ncbi:MAG TPA: LPS assembly protein LptD, partial [Bryobacteraceae bacterium]|nr:LPS assembly protein LptD [Bryobacteraceae bacterium]
AKVQTTEMVIAADEIDYNSDTAWTYARGHVRLEHFATGDILHADHAEYNLKTEEGKFYAVEGTSPAKILTSPGVLTTTNPFYFKAAWADRIKNRYLLHHGFVTDCTVPKPWWTFNAPLFDIIPGDRAIARNTVLHVKRLPILYLPYFLRPLGRNPRQSGFLTPSFGHSTIRGYFFGGGYYWAINRSYDMDYALQYFTIRGPAHTFDFRGKPNSVSDFNFNYFQVQDRGLPQADGSVIKQGGEQFQITGKTEIWGFTGRLDYNYLSSLVFRQVFSDSFTLSISSEVSSVGYLQRHFKHDAYTLNLSFYRDQLFESVTPLSEPANEVVIQKLPTFEVSGRDQEIVKGPLPVWFSFGASGGLISRQEPTLQTGYLTSRIDLQPRVSTAFSFKGFSLSPSVTFGVTDYSKQYSSNSPTTATVVATPLLRKTADVVLDFRLPTIERIFAPPAWLHLGSKLKHVIETQAVYENVSGVNQFNNTIHFDAGDLLANTNQLTLSMTNRLYKKDAKGNVNEILTWSVTQARYFDPTFGGAVLPGQRNVVLEAEELTPYTFLDGPRSYSPVESALTVSPYAFFSLTYRAAYDPLRQKFVDHQISSSFRHSNYFVHVDETAITINPLLIPQVNQLTFGAGYGSSTRRGWNFAGTLTYDLNASQLLYEFAQISYNTNCCGFSVQLRRINVGVRDDVQYMYSFSLANLGTFGTLQKQDRIF